MATQKPETTVFYTPCLRQLDGLDSEVISSIELFPLKRVPMLQCNCVAREPLQSE
jgi:hypothetical protein